MAVRGGGKLKNRSSWYEMGRCWGDAVNEGDMMADELAAVVCREAEPERATDSIRRCVNQLCASIPRWL